MNKPVRVRFAPSPTGGLHIGGVRTALFNYLYAAQHGGTFILRIEDTDQSRYVPGAEEYINDCLAWCGMLPAEGVRQGGDYGPYKQSERRELYRSYADKLVAGGHAYLAFDTPEELEQARAKEPNFLYGQKTRMKMRNSLTLGAEETQRLLAEDAPYVVRIKVPEDEQVVFTDMIRGRVAVDTNLLDDKVLLKADGMPTYHLAVVVDDYEMKISHVFRGEEWLPSAPVHILLWKYIGQEENMPAWAHLPLILKPDGNGKLSKRDGERLGFPVFAMTWKDPKTGSETTGYKEQGFIPEAFINFLALLGWNDGTDKEIFSLQELAEAFNIERVAKAGARFDYEKAKWFNKEWLAKTPDEELAAMAMPYMQQAGIMVSTAELAAVLPLVKDRLVLLGDVVTQAGYFFKAPEQYDLEPVMKKWNAEKAGFFKAYAAGLPAEIVPADEEQRFKAMAAEAGLKPGDVMLPLRIMLVGGKYGPDVFSIARQLGTPQVQQRIAAALAAIANEQNK